MTKRIQGRTGDSLAGIYDVVGGAVDVAHLEDTEVQLTHDMGEVAFSERIRTDMRIVESLAVAQSSDFDVAIDDLPGGPFRLQWGCIFASTAARIDSVCLSLELGDGSRGIPLLTFVSTSDTARTSKFVLGGALVTRTVLNPTFNAFPILGLGRFQGQPSQQARILRLAGTTLAFGAGTVDVQAMVMSTHTEIPGGQQQPRSYGLPVPSW